MNFVKQIFFGIAGVGILHGAVQAQTTSSSVARFQEPTYCDMLKPGGTRENPVAFDYCDTLQYFIIKGPSQSWRPDRLYLVDKYFDERVLGAQDGELLDGPILNYFQSTSRIMRGLLELYDLTGDRRFLDLFVMASDHVRTTASVPATYDTDRSRVWNRGWPERISAPLLASTGHRTSLTGYPKNDQTSREFCNRYKSADYDGTREGERRNTDCKYFIDDNGDGEADYTRVVAHSARILVPMLEFANLVKSDTLLAKSPDLAEAADANIRLAIDVMNNHESEYCSSENRACGQGGAVSRNVRPLSDEGFYFWDVDHLGVKSWQRGHAMPTNYQSAIGSAFLQMSILERNGHLPQDAYQSRPLPADSYDRRVANVSRIVKRAFENVEEDGETYHYWTYWYRGQRNFADEKGWPIDTARADDIGHAGETLEFITRLVADKSSGGKDTGEAVALGKGHIRLIARTYEHLLFLQDQETNDTRECLGPIAFYTDGSLRNRDNNCDVINGFIYFYLDLATGSKSSPEDTFAYASVRCKGGYLDTSNKQPALEFLGQAKLANMAIELNDRTKSKNTFCAAAGVTPMH